MLELEHLMDTQVLWLPQCTLRYKCKEAELTMVWMTGRGDWFVCYARVVDAFDVWSARNRYCQQEMKCGVKGSSGCLRKKKKRQFGFRALSDTILKHLSPNPAIFPWCNAAMAGAKLMIAKHLTCHVHKHSPDGWKENMFSLREGILLHTAATDKTRRYSCFTSNCVLRT